jgi:hypothetical protein
MRYYILQIAFLFIVGSCFTSCSPVDDQEKKYAGTWKFCSKGVDFPEPMIDYAETSDLILNENGEWSFGGSSGKWGTKEEVEDFSFDRNNFDLGFSDTEMSVSNHSNQYERTSAYIDMIEGVETLILHVEYSYDQNNFYQNSYGEVDNKISKGIGDIEYYFVRSTDNDACNKLKNAFGEAEKIAMADRYLRDNPNDPFAYIQTDSASLSKLFIGLEYNQSRQKLTNTNQKIALAFLYALKKDKDKYAQLFSTIPIDKDSLSRGRLEFLVAFLDGQRDFSVYDCKTHRYYLTLFTKKIFVNEADIPFYEEGVKAVTFNYILKEDGQKEADRWRASN